MPIIDNRRMARNSAFLYIRSILLMAITLYTSRVVLSALGESDFGVYSVVGGVVTLFSFVNTALVRSTQRFMNVSIGSGDDSELRRVFSSTLLIHFAFAIVIVILSETAGLWLVNRYLNIPEESRTAANWVLQFSMVTAAFNVLSAPYNAAIISHERMSVFTWFSSIEGVLKLSVAFIIANAPSHRLIVYSALLCAVSIIIRSIYNFYCTRHFAECRRIDRRIDLPLIKRITSFSVWTLCGSLSFIANTQGLSIVVNLFFGTIVNAALSLANLVNAAASQMIDGFLQAVRPQIMKAFASGDVAGANSLVTRGSKIAFLLTAAFVIPMSLEVDFVLHLWLAEVPDYTSGFIMVILVISLIQSPLLVLSAIQEAVGRIRLFELIGIIGSVISLTAAWLTYKAGYSPVAGLYGMLAFSAVAMILRFMIVRRATGLSMRRYAASAILRPAVCMAVGFVAALAVKLNCTDSALTSIAVIAVFEAVYIAAALFVGLSRAERSSLLRYIRRK